MEPEVYKIKNKLLGKSELLQPLADLQNNPFSLQPKATPQDNAAKTAWDTIKNSTTDAGQKVANFINTFSGKTSTAIKVGKGLEAVAGTAGAILSPISAIFAGAEKVPVLGSVSKLISLPFMYAGEGGKVLFDRMLSHDGILGQLPEETKNAIKIGGEEISSLAVQFALGAATAGIEKGIKERFSPEEAKIIIETAKKVAPELPKTEVPITEKPITPPVSKLAELAKTKPEEIKPVISAIPKELEPLAEEASWSKLQKENPDLFNTGILRKSQAPYPVGSR